MFNKLFSISQTNKHKIITIFGIKLKLRKRDGAITIGKDLFCQILNASDNIILYIDLNIGGGTEMYFFNQLKKYRNNNIIVRLQNLFHNGLYKITIFERNKAYKINDIDFNEFSSYINLFNLKALVLNNIVGYPSVKTILDFIQKYKNTHEKTQIIFKGHDFYAVCPSWNLVNQNKEFCGIQYDDNVCEKCYDGFLLKCTDIQEHFSITEWRKTWNNFFENYADKIEVFSPSSQKIFETVFPEIKNKIICIPHRIQPFKIYNIGILGHLSIEKGANVIQNFINYLDDYGIRDYKFTIFGKNPLKINSQSLTSCGEYVREHLPKILKQKKIDLILIPSICPETFSYTTAEAIALGYPVACFDIGGQADQVKKYKHGLILSSQSPDVMDNELKEFLDSLRIENGFVHNEHKHHKKFFKF